MTLALIQPWLVAIYKKIFRQGEIDIYETGNLEIGYSSFGPTIGINGTLRCRHRDLFVQDINLELVKQKDSSRHTFGWGVFRSIKLSTSGDHTELEIPYGFMLSISSPRRFNIQFHDLQLQSEMRQIIDKVSKKWNDGLTKLEQENSLLLLSPSTTEYQDLILNYYNEFKKSDVHVQTYINLDRICYWEAGKYTFKMEIKTKKPDRIFKKSWDFSLTDQEVSSIRLNSVVTVHGVSGIC